MMIDATVLGNRVLSFYRIQKLMDGKCVTCKENALKNTHENLLDKYLRTGCCGSCQNHFESNFGENNIN